MFLKFITSLKNNNKHVIGYRKYSLLHKIWLILSIVHNILKLISTPIMRYKQAKLKSSICKI